jgi:hypothetical protein
MTVHLSIGVWWNPSWLTTPLLNHFVYPYERNKMIVCYASSCRLSVEDEWLKSARDRALPIDGGPIWFSKMMEWLASLDTGWEGWEWFES